MSRVEIGGEAFEVRDLTTLDRDALIALHVEVFGASAGASEAWYDWKYVRGGSIGAGVWHGGRLIAHCGGIPRRLRIGGRDDTGLQIGDVMVAERWRGVLTRRGPFFHASRTMYDAHVGDGTGHAVAFGFPSERHMRLAVKSGLAWDAGAIHALQWKPASANLGWSWRWEPLAGDSPRFDPAVSRAWQRMRETCAAKIVGERDAAYLRWRFLQRPGHRYSLFTLRRAWTLHVAGVAVLDLSTSNAQWLDWIGTPEHMLLASRACAGEAARAGASELTAWVTPAVRECLQGSGTVHDAIVARLGVPRRSELQPEEAARTPWWMMGGDTDFL